MSFRERARDRPYVETWGPSGNTSLQNQGHSFFVRARLPRWPWRCRLHGHRVREVVLHLCGVWVAPHSVRRAAAQLRSDEREIRTLHSIWIDAVNAGDLTRLLTLVAEDVVFLTPGEAPLGREGFSSNFMAVHQQMRISYQHTGRGRCYGRGRLNVELGRTLSVPARVGGRWHISSGIA